MKEDLKSFPLRVLQQLLNFIYLTLVTNFTWSKFRTEAHLTSVGMKCHNVLSCHRLIPSGTRIRGANEIKSSYDESGSYRSMLRWILLIRKRILKHSPFGLSEAQLPSFWLTLQRGRGETGIHVILWESYRWRTYLIATPEFFDGRIPVTKMT